MTSHRVSDGPDLDAMIALVRERWPDASIARLEDAVFFSLDEQLSVIRCCR